MLKAVLKSFEAFAIFGNSSLESVTVLRAKRNEMLDSGTPATSDFVVLKIMRGGDAPDILVALIKMARPFSDSKRSGCRAKGSEIWDSGTLVTYISGTFDLIVKRVILGSFGAFVSK